MAKRVKNANKKICVYNKLTNDIQIVPIFVYNKLKNDILIKILNSIRIGKCDKQRIYLYSYEFSNKYGKCAVILNKSFLFNEYEVQINKLKSKYNISKVHSLNGEQLL